MEAEEEKIKYYLFLARGSLRVVRKLSINDAKWLNYC